MPVPATDILSRSVGYIKALSQNLRCANRESLAQAVNPQSGIASCYEPSLMDDDYHIYEKQISAGASMNIMTTIQPKPMCMATHSGGQFNPLSPHASDVQIEDIAHALAFQCRFNGHTRKFYSVAQHCLHVSQLVPKHLQLAALLHDAAEAYLGDIVTPVKAAIPDFAELETRVMAVICQRFGLNAALSPTEQRLIKRADLIALATERRDLMPNARGDWEYLGGVVAHPSLIEPLDPLTAKRAFLTAFSRLLKESQELLVMAA